MAILAFRPVADSSRCIGTAAGRVIRIIAGTCVVALTGEGAILVNTVQFADDVPVCAPDVIRGIAAALDDRS